MKNKIGILENDIYIFPIVNSVICEVYSFVMFLQFWYVLEMLYNLLNSKTE